MMFSDSINTWELTCSGIYPAVLICRRIQWNFVADWNIISVTKKQNNEYIKTKNIPRFSGWYLLTYLISY